MAEPRRVTIIDTNYTEEYNLVEWVVKDEADKEIVLAWRGSDLGTALGITQEITPEHMIKFCEEIKGKTINLIIEGAIKEMPNIEDMTTDQIHRLSNEMDKYPFDETIQEMNKAESEKEQ